MNNIIIIIRAIITLRHTHTNIYIYIYIYIYIKNINQAQQFL